MHLTDQSTSQVQMFNKFPVELHHQVIAFLDVKDILALRQTCRRFFALTKDPRLWLTIFIRLRIIQALPCSPAEFVAMSPSLAERILYLASEFHKSFLEPRNLLEHHTIPVRQCYLTPPMRATTCLWPVLSFISDRFLLSVDSGGVVIYDTSSTPAVGSPSSWAHFTLPNFIGYSSYHSLLCFAVSRMTGDHDSATVYTVSLPSLGAGDEHCGQMPHREAEFPLLEGEILKQLDPYQGRALLYCQPASIHIVHWRDANKRTTIPIELGDVDQQWNGILALRFCGPYVLCFRVRSVEAYPIPSGSTTTPLPVLHHPFGPLCFRSISLSRVRASAGNDAYTIFMLSNDIYSGMFHYQIRVTLRGMPQLSVRVLAQGGIPLPDPPPLMPGTTDVRLTMEDVVRRTFVSTWSLGDAGLRGVWVERPRASIDRKVVAFTTHPRRLQGNSRTRWQEREGDVADEVAPPMEGKVVHIISSYDLRDDVTICAVSEWTGRIALGSRTGAISIM